MHPATQAAVSLVTAALLTLTATSCGTDESAGDTADPTPTASSDSPAPDLERVGSVLPGGDWTLVDAEGVGRSEGEYEVNADGPAGADPPEVTVTWRRAHDYDDYVDDRADVGRPEPVQVLGAAGLLYTYSDHDFTVLRAVDGASFIELRGTYLNRDQYDAFLAGLAPATEAEFTAALEDAGVTPER
jgi:hypothetical protein